MKDNLNALSKHQTARAQQRLIGRVNAMIIRLMRDQNVSQKDLSEKLGVSAAHVSKVVGEGSANLTLNTVAKIFGALGQEVKISTPRIDEMDKSAKTRVEQTVSLSKRSQEFKWNFVEANDFIEYSQESKVPVAEVA